MSQNLKDVFNRIQKSKKEQKEIKSIYNDALLNNAQYQEIMEELKALKLKKNQIEASIKQDFEEEFNKLDSIKVNIASDTQLLSDIALAQLTRGETVKIVDDNKVEYDPRFTVKFNKIT